jgi:hypothetical protein
MVTKGRDIRGDSIQLPTINKKKSKKWFIGGQLVTVYARNRAANLVYLRDIKTDVLYTMTGVDFKKKRKKAYSIKETAALLNYHEKSIPRLVKKGWLPEPVSAGPGGVRQFGYRSYFCEDDIYECREAMASTHIGRPRKDGLITNRKTPTEQELRAAMGDGQVYYVRTEDGRFVPIFSETI